MATGETPLPGNTFWSRLIAAERDLSCADGPLHSGSISLVRSHPPVTGAFSSNEPMQCWQGFRVRCSSPSPHSVTASWKHATCEEFGGAVPHRQSADVDR